MYKNIGNINDIVQILLDNNLFSLTFERMGRIIFDNNFDKENISEINKIDIIKEIIQNVSFEEIYEWILEADYLEHPFLGEDIVQCMFPKYNKEDENLDKIYDCVSYKEHENEKPVFFVDTSLTGSRTKGLLVTTKGLYRNGKGMISLTAEMPVKINDTMKELNVKHTCVLSFNGSHSVFRDIVELFQVVYIFNTLRFKEGETVEKYENMFTVDENGDLQYNPEAARNQAEKKRPSEQLNDSGVGNGSNPSVLWGIIIWIIIILLVLKGCAL